ncbi:MAG TPA: LysR family transcriptional regulator [Polyangiaceae bacterium]|nr:LysR family transcriptional regulator [Polyangiaceae bacterium]
MTHVDIRAVNLNLLSAFDALLEERNVTRAARKMGVTQSAMSSSLAQLRVLFEEPLFRRTPRGIEPTPRALELGEPIRRGLLLFDRALTPQSFDPGTDSRVFVLGTSDYVEFVLLPPLLKRLAREAPGVRVEVRPWGLQQVPKALQAGELDLMIGFYDELPAHHAETLLFDENYVCIARKGHPGLGRKPTLKSWLAQKHVLVSQQGSSPGSVDRALAARNLKRTIGARVSHFLLVPTLVARTDLVAAVNARVATAFADSLGLRVFAPPLPLPKGRIGQVWHEQLEHDPAQRWFRRVIAEECRQL